MIKSKRGRKPKNKNIEDISNNLTNNIVDIKVDISNNLPKKRGRKPKGGKIIQNTSINDKILHVMPNIILHLHCNIEDVNNTFSTGEDYVPTITSVQNYDNNNDYFKSSFSVIASNIELENTDSIDYSDLNKNYGTNFLSKELASNESLLPESSNQEKDIVSNNLLNKLENDKGENEKVKSKIVSKKLKELSYKLHNNICDNKSACFWCTCKFNTANIYIPKNIQEETINVYGCFCSPECATSYLMNEHIDTSIKFERYSLINYIYGSIYNYKNNIKPAPNPYYTLDKFCGNLSIEEYRSHFTDDNLLIVANKPQSRIMPELFEENNMSSNDMRYSINKYS